MVRGPAPRPCGSCPYRQDVPSGVWHPEEYAKLPAYDRPTAEQPVGLFLCHQTGADDPQKRVCAGWVGCHGIELLGLRIAMVDGRMSSPEIVAAATYSSPVPLFGSGAEAAAHGMRDVEHPSREAVTAGAKIVARRSDITTEEGN